MTYEHREIAITFAEDRGDFTATVAGRFIRKSSLKDMKKHIDQVETDGFVPFKALEWDYSEPSLNEVLVTGIEKRRGRCRDNRWEIDGHRMVDKVAENTIDNINRIRLYRKKSAEYDKLLEAKEKELEKIMETITRLTPP